MSIVLSPSYVAESGFPATHARIGYDNIVPDSEVTASSEASGFPASSVKNATTYDRWKGNGPLPTLIVHKASGPNAPLVNYIGIAAQVLASTIIDIDYSEDGETWTFLESIEPSDNSAIMLLFETVQARYWRFTISGGAESPEIGVLNIGQALTMERPIYGGHRPGKLSRRTSYSNNMSESGQFLGRSIVRRGYKESFNWQNLTAAWYRENFDPFVAAARTKPFFIAWRPATFPDEVLYAWTNDDISPSNSGGRDLMTVSINVEGLG